MKTCTKCQCSKPAADFYDHKTTADRLHPYCMPCMSAYNRERPARARLRWAAIARQAAEGRV